jgi:hypothetical protein
MDSNPSAQGLKKTQGTGVRDNQPPLPVLYGLSY